MANPLAAGQTISPQTSAHSAPAAPKPTTPPPQPAPPLPTEPVVPAVPIAPPPRSSRNQQFLSRALIIVGVLVILGVTIFLCFIFTRPKPQTTGTEAPTPSASTDNTYTATPTPTPPESLSEIVPVFDNGAFAVRTSGVINYKGVIVGFERAVLYFRNGQLEVKAEQLYDGGNQNTFLQANGDLYIVNSQQKEYYFLANGAKATTLDISSDSFRNSHPLAILYREIKSGNLKPTKDKDGLWDVTLDTSLIDPALPKALPAKMVLTPDQQYIARIVFYQNQTGKQPYQYGDLQFFYEKTTDDAITNLKAVPSNFRRNDL